MTKFKSINFFQASLFTLSSSFIFAEVRHDLTLSTDEIYFENPAINNSNAILEELETFSDAIEGKNTPLVSLENGTEALNIAFQIIKAYS